MGHRALVAYARPDGRYDCYYAHWGGVDLGLAERLVDPERDPVAPEPLATARPFAAVVDGVLDPLVHEALYVVDREGVVGSRSGPDRERPVTAYRALWLGPIGADGGLLVAVDPGVPCDDARVQSWFRGARSIAAACRERESLGATEAATLLEAHLRDWAGDREVLRCPGD